jgi:phenylacetate-CoA ligase
MAEASIKSVHATARFPAVPGPQAALLLSLLHQLETSQWWPADRLAEEQRAQLEILTDHARRTVPWYRDRLPSNRFVNREGAEAAWRRIPVLSRVDLQRHPDALRSTEPPSGHRQLRRVSTSGATGTPISVDTTEAARLMWMAILLREHAWHRRDLSMRHVAVRLFGDKVDAAWPHGARRADWGPPENVVYESGPSAMLDISASVQQQLEWLVAEDPQILLTFPSNAVELARRCRTEGIAFPNLRELRLVSEAIDPESRKFLSDTWGVPITDVYSAQEVGYIALQCPEHPHYHVQSESVYVEVIDDEGLACGPGETGRVVVTSLHNLAMPLIRYDIGDYAEVGDTCACGRGLPVLKRVFGRVRNMLTLPGGERRWPNLSGPFYRDIAPVTQHQIVQHDVDTIEARLVIERPLLPREEEALRELILRRLGHAFALSLTYHPRIERSRSGKFEEFLSKVEPTSADAATPICGQTS